MNKNFFKLIDKKLNNKVDDDFDREFWTKFEGENKHKNYSLFQVAWAKGALALVCSLLVVIFIFNNQKKNDFDNISLSYYEFVDVSNIYKMDYIKQFDEMDNEFQIITDSMREFAISIIPMEYSYNLDEDDLEYYLDFFERHYNDDEWMEFNS